MKSRIAAAPITIALSLVACGPQTTVSTGDCTPELRNPPETKVVEGSEVYVAHLVFPDPEGGGDGNVAASCLLFVQVGPSAYESLEWKRIRSARIRTPLSTVLSTLSVGPM